MSAIFGNFRWLFLLIGFLVASLVAWAFWPTIEAYTPVSQETVTVTDSTEIRALRDSLSMMRTHSQNTRIIRVTLKDSIKGTTAIYLDSGAVVHDSIFLTHTIHDTLSIHVKDSLYVKKTYSPKKWGVDGGVFVSYYPLGSLEYGASAGVRYKVIGPVFVSARVEKKGFDSFSDGWKLKATAGIEF